jgi:hypothetical protein
MFTARTISPIRKLQEPGPIVVAGVLLTSDAGDEKILGGGIDN